MEKFLYRAFAKLGSKPAALAKVLLPPPSNSPDMQFGDWLRMRICDWSCDFEGCVVYLSQKGEYIEMLVQGIQDAVRLYYYTEKGAVVTWGCKPNKWYADNAACEILEHKRDTLQQSLISPPAPKDPADVMRCGDWLKIKVHTLYCTSNGKELELVYKEEHEFDGNVVYCRRHSDRIEVMLQTFHNISHQLQFFFENYDFGSSKWIPNQWYTQSSSCEIVEHRRNA